MSVKRCRVRPRARFSLRRMAETRTTRLKVQRCIANPLFRMRAALASSGLLHVRNDHANVQYRITAGATAGVGTPIIAAGSPIPRRGPLSPATEGALRVTREDDPLRR